MTANNCIIEQNTSQANFITYDDMVALWERRKAELMKLSKEELVEILIGKREHVGMIFG